MTTGMICPTMNPTWTNTSYKTDVDHILKWTRVLTGYYVHHIRQAKKELSTKITEHLDDNDTHGPRIIMQVAFADKKLITITVYFKTCTIMAQGIYPS